MQNYQGVKPLAGFCVGYNEIAKKKKKVQQTNAEVKKTKRNHEHIKFKVIH